MNKYQQLTDLQEHLDSVLDELDYTNKGLTEWRSVALEALAALRGVVVAKNADALTCSIGVARSVVGKYPTSEVK